MMICVVYGSRRSCAAVAQDVALARPRAGAGWGRKSSNRRQWGGCLGMHEGLCALHQGGHPLSNSRPPFLRRMARISVSTKQSPFRTGSQLTSFRLSCEKKKILDSKSVIRYDRHFRSKF